VKKTANSRGNLASITLNNTEELKIIESRNQTQRCFQTKRRNQSLLIFAERPAADEKDADGNIADITRKGGEMRRRGRGLTAKDPKGRNGASNISGSRRDSGRGRMEQRDGRAGKENRMSGDSAVPEPTCISSLWKKT